MSKRADLKQRYRAASLHVQNLDKEKNGIDITPYRWKLYGYHKQTMEGDCTHSCPQGEGVLKNKFNAWVANKGMSKDDAMSQFIQLVEKFDPKFASR